MEDDDELTERIKSQVDEWSSSSNECTTLQLVRGDGTVLASFQPEFTYPIFGDEEAIFGYQDLDITIAFAAHDLKPRLEVNYGKMFPAQGEVRPTDITEALRGFLPEVAFREKLEIGTEAVAFRPPGERVHQYGRGGKQFEIWCASLADPRAKQVLENMQILVPMFIEGGTMLQLEQDWTTQRWKLFLLYQLTDTSAAGGSSPYSLIGYATSYHVFTLPDRQNPLQSDLDLFLQRSQSLESLMPPSSRERLDSKSADAANTPLDLPSRERLSQFLILPPYQRGGHGQELYDTMYATLASPANVREFTVEDPNEAFDDLRDYCDLRYLRHHRPDFAALRVNSKVPSERLQRDTHIPIEIIVDGPTRDKITKETKIMQRQFDRLVEMHTLSFIPVMNRSRTRVTRKEKSSNEHDRAYYLWRLYAKQRLYIFNRDQLAQLERAERVDKLEAALDSVQEAYVKMLEKVGASPAIELSGGSTTAGASLDGPIAPRARKRKVLEEDDEVDIAAAEDAGADASSPMLNGSKKVRPA